MEQQAMQYMQQQKDTWNKFSDGWRKWDDLSMDFLKPFGEALILRLQLKNDAQVLDVAAGTGEPTITIANMLKAGNVVATDLSENMLEVAKKKVAVQSIKNVTFEVCDVTDMPFSDETFDAVSCRFGFMFFPDMQEAARQMHRVLKPGGRLATTVWVNPENNYWVTAIMDVITRYIDVPKPPPDAPSIFRCGKPGLMRNLLHNAGFNDVSEALVDSRLNAGTADNYWNFMMEVAAPVVSALTQTDEQTRQQVKTEVFNNLHDRFAENKVNIPSEALVISAVK